MSQYVINGKTAVGWRIDRLATEEGEAQALGLDFLRDYVAFVREKPVAEQIVALLNESEATPGEPRAAPSPALPRAQAVRLRESYAAARQRDARLTTKARERAAEYHSEKPPKKTGPLCSAKTRRGNPCAMASSTKSGLCFTHAASAWDRHITGIGFAASVLQASLALPREAPEPGANTAPVAYCASVTEQKRWSAPEQGGSQVVYGAASALPRAAPADSAPATPGLGPPSAGRSAHVCSTVRIIHSTAMAASDGCRWASLRLRPKPGAQ